MKQLSTRGHTTRAHDKDELYRSIVDMDGNLLEPEVLERFEENANKMVRSNKEHEEQKKNKDGADVSNIAGTAQKVVGVSDDIMEKARGILEEELSDAETDIAEGDETGGPEKNDTTRKESDNKKASDDNADEDAGKKDDIRVRSRSWTQEEDDLVQMLVGQLGPKKWALIAAQLSGKTQKQAYARWRDYLQPGLTTRPWTRWEELHLLDVQAYIGNQWAVLARLMPGRSPNAIKNRFHATKRKKERNHAKSDWKNQNGSIQAWEQFDDGAENNKPNKKLTAKNEENGKKSPKSDNRKASTSFRKRKSADDDDVAQSEDAAPVDHVLSDAHDGTVHQLQRAHDNGEQDA